MNIPDYPWFGPRHGMGWGWAPVNWEGNTVIIAFLVLIVAARLIFRRAKTFVYVVFGLVGVLLVVCALTGTAPG